MLGSHAQSKRSATHRVRRNKKNERTSRPMLASKAAGMAFEDCCNVNNNGGCAKINLAHPPRSY